MIDETMISELESRLAACGDAGWCTVSAEVLERALDALKEGVPRVLTPDEARWGGDVWCEWRHYPAELVLVYETQQSAHFCRMALLTGGVAEEAWKHYGKLWRCWNAEPSDEQRKAVEWND